MLGPKLDKKKYKNNEKLNMIIYNNHKSIKDNFE